MAIVSRDQYKELSEKTKREVDKFDRSIDEIIKLNKAGKPADTPTITLCINLFDLFLHSDGKDTQILEGAIESLSVTLLEMFEIRVSKEVEKIIVSVADITFESGGNIANAKKFIKEKLNHLKRIQ